MHFKICRVSVVTNVRENWMRILKFHWEHGKGGEPIEFEDVNVQVEKM